MGKVKNILIASLLFSLTFILFFSFSSIEYSGLSLANNFDFINVIHPNPKELGITTSTSNTFTSEDSTPTPVDTVDTIPSNAKLSKQSTIDIPNSLHLYQWFQFCQDSLPILKSWPLFPNFPFSHTFISSLSISVKDADSVFRIFGFLIPPSDGKYAFACNQIQSLELWISEDESPANLKQISLKQLQSDELENSMINSDDSVVKLRKGNHHYMELFLAVRIILISEVSLSWLSPGDEHFSTIDKEYFGATSKQAEQTSPSPNPPYPPYADTLTPPSILERKYQLLALPYLDLEEVDEVYEECEYRPSFAHPRHVNKYEGVGLIVPMVLSVFPDDLTSFNRQINDYNQVMPQEEADKILASHTKVMQEKWPKIKSVTLVNLEVQRDPEKGNRYLIETEVELDEKKRFRFSQFIFSPKAEPDSLCQPKGFNYQSEVFVHIAISVKNQGHWLQYFINNVERIYQETKDKHFGIIVIDFDSEDVDAESVVKKSLLPHKVFVRMEGRYERASSLNKALEQVKSANEIVYTCDLHLEMPNDIIESIRKHTIRGFSGYAPVVFRLECGRTYLEIGGYWENLGYGLFSMYKSDWDNVGAFDSQMFRDKWGGEDWDLVDRFISKGYFMDRMRQSYMFHFHHDRSRLW